MSPDISPHICCLTANGDGKNLPLVPERPICMDVKKKKEVVGHLRFFAEAGTWVFLNESPVASQVNGQALQRAVLTDGDRVQVGGLEFQAHIPDPGTGGFARPVETAEVVDEVAEEEPLHDIEESDADLDAIDARDGMDSGNNGRTSRRISASREAIVIDHPNPKNQSGRLLQKMGKALRRRGGRRQQLDELAHERDRLLRIAGRQALEQIGGFGLPADFLQQLCAGETATVDAESVRQEQLRSFRTQRERLAALDVEIESIRLELGMGIDPDLAPPVETLPTEVQAQVERAFTASDGMGTEDLGVEQPDSGEQDPDDPASMARTSNRRRRVRRRR